MIKLKNYQFIYINMGHILYFLATSHLDFFKYILKKKHIVHTLAIISYVLIGFHIYQYKSNIQDTFNKEHKLQIESMNNAYQLTINNLHESINLQKETIDKLTIKNEKLTFKQTQSINKIKFLQDKLFTVQYMIDNKIAFPKQYITKRNCTYFNSKYYNYFNTKKDYMKPIVCAN